MGQSITAPAAQSRIVPRVEIRVQAAGRPPARWATEKKRAGCEPLGVKELREPAVARLRTAPGSRKAKVM